MKKNKNKVVLPVACENPNNVSVTTLSLNQVGVKVSNDFEGEKPVKIILTSVDKDCGVTLKCIMLRKTAIFIQWSKMTNKIANKTFIGIRGE